MICWAYSLDSPRRCDPNEYIQHSFITKKERFPKIYFNIFFLSCRKNFLGTKKRFCNSHGQRTISVRDTECLLYQQFLASFRDLNIMRLLKRIGFTRISVKIGFTPWKEVHFERKEFFPFCAYPFSERIFCVRRDLFAMYKMGENICNVSSPS